MKRLWPFPVGQPEWIHARSSFNRCVDAGCFDVSAFYAGLLAFRLSLGKGDRDPPSPQDWIIRRGWIDRQPLAFPMARAA